jgi:RNA 3'-terminal phosphate cyclase (ATP)
MPFALADAGAFTTVKPSQHSLTAVSIVSRFLDRQCVFEHLPPGEHRWEMR